MSMSIHSHLRYEPLDAIRGSPTLSADGHVVYLVGSMKDSVGGEYEGG